MRDRRQRGKSRKVEGEKKTEIPNAVKSLLLRKRNGGKQRKRGFGGGEAEKERGSATLKVLFVVFPGGTRTNDRGPGCLPFVQVRGDEQGTRKITVPQNLRRKPNSVRADLCLVGGGWLYKQRMGRKRTGQGGTREQKMSLFRFRSNPKHQTVKKGFRCLKNTRGKRIWRQKVGVRKSGLLVSDSEFLSPAKGGDKKVARGERLQKMGKKTHETALFKRTQNPTGDSHAFAVFKKNGRCKPGGGANGPPPWVPPPAKGTSKLPQHPGGFPSNRGEKSLAMGKGRNKVCNGQRFAAREQNGKEGRGGWKRAKHTNFKGGVCENNSGIRKNGAEKGDRAGEKKCQNT